MEIKKQIENFLKKIEKEKKYIIMYERKNKSGPSFWRQTKPLKGEEAYNFVIKNLLYDYKNITNINVMIEAPAKGENFGKGWEEESDR